MFVLLLLFSVLSYAEETATEKYCFSSGLQALQARQKYKAIEVGSDTVTVDENCLIIQMRPHRREIIQRYILSNMAGARLTFSSETTRRDPCRLKVEKVKTSQSKNINGQVNKIGLSLEEKSTHQNASEISQIQTLKEFELTMNQDQIKGNCRYITSDRYEISLEVRKNPKPVLVETERPEDQETMVIQTQLQLTRGERIEVGSIIRKESDKNRQVKISPEGTIDSMNQQESEKVFLSLL